MCGHIGTYGNDIRLPVHAGGSGLGSTSASADICTNCEFSEGGLANGGSLSVGIGRCGSATITVRTVDAAINGGGDDSAELAVTSIASELCTSTTAGVGDESDLIGTCGVGISTTVVLVGSGEDAISAWAVTSIVNVPSFGGLVSDGTLCDGISGCIERITIVSTRRSRSAFFARRWHDLSTGCSGIATGVHGP